MKKKYQAKALPGTFQETEGGFKARYHKNNNENPIHLEIIWPNKSKPVTEDSGEPWDFEIIKDKEKRLLEVKSTLSSDKKEFKISGREIKVMQEYGSRYYFFRVYGAYSRSARAEKIKDPATALAKQEILYTKATLRI